MWRVLRSSLWVCGSGAEFQGKGGGDRVGMGGSGTRNSESLEGQQEGDRTSSHTPVTHKGSADMAGAMSDKVQWDDTHPQFPAGGTGHQLTRL